VEIGATSLADLAGAVRTRQVSARELVAASLAAIEAKNGAVNAFVAVDGDRALADAATIDERIAAGDDVGPLAGIPIGVKDLEDAAGFRTTFGSAVHATAPPAEHDSLGVARLRAAGCVVVGKTNMPEFGLRGETDNRTFGITRNPWNLDHTPGGSSGGTSAAIAAGMVPLATGSDGGGSIRIPSAATALSGLKPSLGRVPGGDRSAPGWNFLSTRGPMARHIRDVALALDAMAGPHPYDAMSLPASDVSFVEALADLQAPLRVGWSPDLGYADVDRDVLAVCEAAVHRLEASGSTVLELKPVFSESPGLPLGALVQTFTARTVEPYRGTEFWNELDPLVIVSAEMAKARVATAIDMTRALDACHQVNIELADAMADIDLLLCPTTRAAPAVCDNPTTVDSLLGLFASDLPSLPDDVAPMLMGLLEMLRSLEPFNVPIGTVNGEPTVEWHGMTQAFNVTRVPAGTVCAGFTSLGLPVGLQVVGHHHDDVGVLRAVAWIEDLLALDLIPPLAG
jgi:Asp-tRNA(Asn)/Glu-tRNA(Gln) amidotransferase A subunit family amidase